MRILQSVFDSINNLVVKSTQVNFENAQQKLFKMERSDITLRRIHEVLLDLPFNPDSEPEAETAEDEDIEPEADSEAEADDMAEDVEEAKAASEAGGVETEIDAEDTGPKE